MASIIVLNRGDKIISTQLTKAVVPVLKQLSQQ
jgi:hypothetical protein